MAGFHRGEGAIQLTGESDKMSTEFAQTCFEGYGERYSTAREATELVVAGSEFWYWRTLWSARCAINSRYLKECERGSGLTSTVLHGSSVGIGNINILYFSSFLFTPDFIRTFKIYFCNKSCRLEWAYSKNAFGIFGGSP